jgi:hypothetical protein
MAKAKKGTAKSETTESKGVLTEGGIFVDAKVITGKNHRLSAKEQGQIARGELDENLEPTGKEVKRPDVKTIKTSQTLYQGKLSAEAIAGATGEKVSVVWEQAMPTTEDGCFHSFQQYHPSAIRDTFKIDPSNTIDPTLRTSLERP